MARTRGGTGHGQWLLLAALLFGIVTMHTVGHPSGGSGGGSAHGGGHGSGAAAVASVPVAGAALDGVSARMRDGGHAPGPGASAPGMPGGHAPRALLLAHDSVGVPPSMSGPSVPPLPSAHSTYSVGALGAGPGPGSGSGSGDERGGDRGGVLPVTRVTAAPGPAPHDGMAMDPLSVCLAVLGAFTLVLLVRAGLLRPGGASAALPALRRLLLAPRPEPPPPRIRLARLSVLRI